MEPPKKNISIGEAMPLQMIIKGMTMGTVMYKVKTSDKWYRRKYKVDIQNMRLSYAPSSKPFWRGKITSACKCGSFAGSGTNIVDLFDLEEVRKGWNSDVFNKLQAKFRRKLQKTLHPQLLSKTPRGELLLAHHRACALRRRSDCAQYPCPGRMGEGTAAAHGLLQAHAGAARRREVVEGAGEEGGRERQRQPELRGMSRPAQPAQHRHEEEGGTKAV
ncbi:hypothetical protein HNY73_019435 [Argiope bruennichi]|uniref:Uncharacterized protein n=1 Tax=Argiope bruennichi TaxID=94029 RepID=A0A8T0E4P8_ARGBR|nr:hypothetical protein HNY73_019435 [Argiope bruennichi]